MSNKSIYLNKWEKEMIKALIEKHLEENKSNMFYDYVQSDFKKIIKKIDNEVYQKN